MLASPLGAQERIATPATETVLTHVTVVDVVRGVRVPDQDVVLRGAQIVAVRPASTRAYRPPTRVIAGRDRFVIPGLWDMHTHLTDTPWTRVHRSADSVDLSARRYFSALLLAAGVTGVRDLGGDLDVLQRWQQTATSDSTGVPMPRLLATGFKLGEAPVVTGAPFPVRTPDDVRTSVRMARERGASLVKLQPTPPAWLLQAALSECARQRIPCVAHAPESTPLDEVVAGGLSSVEHLFNVADNTAQMPFAMVVAMRQSVLQPTIFQRVLYRTGVADRLDESALDTARKVHSPTRAAALYANMVRRGTWATPTLTLHDLMLRIAPRNRAARDTTLMTEAPTADERRRSPHQLALATADWKMFTQLTREMYHAGVGLLAGTDIPLQAVPGFSLHMELGLLQLAGLAPIDALRTATLNPARYQHAESALGSVAPGRAADLVLLRADPLDDVNAVAAIDAVISRGRVFARADLDAMVSRARADLLYLRAAETTRRIATR